MISIITAARDYGYDKNFLNRLHLSLSKNIEAVEKFGIPYEYLVVEWCPFKNYLIHREEFRDLFEKKNLVDIIVKPEVAKKENLNPEIFYEFFAKNAGIRMSKYDILLILNGDIIIPEKTMKIITDLISLGNFDKDRFYRAMCRVQVDEGLNFLKSARLYRPEDPDAVICGNAAGDFLLINRETLVKCGEGYDETNSGHRTISQFGMDGEILWNLHKKGIGISFLDADYWHIEHERPNRRDGVYNMNGYANKPDWGFIVHPKKVLSEKLIEIG